VANVDYVSDRRSPRQKVVMPVALVAHLEGKKTMLPACVLDVSTDGLRIRTSVRLSAGELVDIQFEKASSGLRQYEVVWTKPAGALYPGQAGLRAVKTACELLLPHVRFASAESQLKAA
jgi:hypothetical protein